MSFVASAVAGSAVLGYVGSQQAGNRAANAQRDAANQSNELQRYMYDQTRADQSKWREAGESALSRLVDPSMMRTFEASDFTKDPGYDFRMREGQRGLEASAAARGNLNSGATLKALQKYGQDYASNEYLNAYNRFNNDRDQRFSKLSSIAGLGQSANSQIANAGQNYANQYSNNQMGMANANAANMISQSNNFNDLMGQGIMAYGLYGRK